MAKRSARKKPIPVIKPGATKIPTSRKIVNNDLAGFTRQLSAMLAAGMPIVSAFLALDEQSDNVYFKAVIRGVREALEAGQSLSESLRKYPAIFDRLYCNMVAGGESSGELAETMARLATFLEDAAKLRRKVKAAMMYPIIVLTISIIITIGLILFVVPVFGEMFEDFDAELPAPTQGLLNLSAFLQAHFLIFAGVVVVLYFIFRKWKRTPSGAYRWDSMVLKIPVFGKLNRYVAAARFARMLSQMARSGVPILSALRIVGGSTGNLVAGKIIEDAAIVVEKGDPLSKALLDQEVYPLALVRMLQAGEKTGNINDMMDSIADYYEGEVDSMLTGLTSLLEPMLMVFLGVVIGGLVICMFLPLFQMGEIVGRG